MDIQVQICFFSHFWTDVFEVKQDKSPDRGIRAYPQPFFGNWNSFKAIRVPGRPVLPWCYCQPPSPAKKVPKQAEETQRELPPWVEAMIEMWWDVQTFRWNWLVPTERKRVMKRAWGVSKIRNHDTMIGASHRVLMMSTSWERSVNHVLLLKHDVFETTNPIRWAYLTEVLTGLCLLEVWCWIYLESKVEAKCEDMSGVYCFRANSCIAKLTFEECRFSGVIFQKHCLELCLHSAEWFLIFWCHGPLLIFVPQVEYRGKIARTPSDSQQEVDKCWCTSCFVVFRWTWISLTL